MPIRAPGNLRPIILVLAAGLLVTPCAVRAADPFEALPSPALPPVAPDLGGRVALPTRPPPQATEVAARFPSDEEPPPGAPYAPPPLRVLRTWPDGQEVRTDTILVEFNQPMVDLDALDVPDIALPPFSVEPRVTGRYLWLGTSVAALQVEGGLPPGSPFEVLVPSGLGAPSGERMERHVRWSFRTASDPGPPVPRDAPRTTAPARGDAPPRPLPVLDTTGTLAAPVPVLEAALLDQAPPFPGVMASVTQAAVAPGGDLELAVVVPPGDAPGGSTGLTITVVSEETGAPVFQQDLPVPRRDGRCTVSIPAPASEGFYRLYVVAARDDLGISVTGLRAWVRVPLTIRPALPPRARAGDRFLVGAVVRNLAFEARNVQVRIRAAGAEVQSDPVSVTLGPGEERTIRVHAATRVPGEAVFQVAAATTTPEKALVYQSASLPVHRSGSVSRAAAYGVVENALRVPFVLPDGASPHTGGLELSVTPDPRIILTDALIGLLDSDAGTDGAELLASRILALHALRDATRRLPFDALPPALRAVTSVPEQALRLLSLQREDGGFAPQFAMRRSDLSTSVWCATALVRARDVGAVIPPPALDRLVGYLTAQAGAAGLTHGQRAMVLRALAMLGVDDAASLDGLYLAASGRAGGSGRPVPLYAKAWLMEALHALDSSDVRIEELYLSLRAAALEHGDGVTFPEDPGAFVPGSLHTPDRTDAVVLHALLTTRPDDTLLPRVASGLIGSLRDGRWSTPRADVWAIQALALYYKDLGRDRTSYEARAWLGDRMFLGTRFRSSLGHTRARIPMADLQGMPGTLLRIGKRGDGRLFYRLALTTARDWAPATSEDHGLQVTRAWSLVQHSRAADRVSPFRVRVEEGDLVRLRIRLVSAELRRRTRVDVPIPGGFVPVAGDDVLPPERTKWDAVESLGHTVRLFLDVLEPGVYEYALTLRAVTPGTWVLPPVRARARHNPGVSGTSVSEEIVILPGPPISG
jgi:hypothetical protein